MSKHEFPVKILYKFLHRYSTYSTSAIFSNKWILIFWGKLTREGKGKTFKLWKLNKKKQNKQNESVILGKIMWQRNENDKKKKKEKLSGGGSLEKIWR